MILAIGACSLISFCCYTGLVIFAAFRDCDPVSTGIVSKQDQLLPYFILKYTSGIPALPGIFVAGVFSAALRSDLTLSVPQKSFYSIPSVCVLFQYDVHLPQLYDRSPFRGFCEAPLSKTDL